jgi:bacteriorhodopsin
MLIESAYFSIVFQLISGLINFYGLSLDISENKKIIKDILKVETTVQIIELVFYVWMINSINIVQNITPYRYADWFFTTPIMLITLMAFINGKGKSLWEYISNEKKDISIIIFLNFLMLLFGFLGEINYLDRNTSVILGFIPFVIYYYKIYNKLDISKKDSIKKNLYWSYFLFWSLYGVAALQDYELKNSIYNILDLFSKNVFGIFLVLNLIYNKNY